MKKKLKMGMIGGGPNSFIGAIHRIAARIDGHIELVAGAFSSDENKSRITGDELGLAPERIYKNFEELILTEAKLPAEKRIDFVSIVTPNHVHYAPAKLAMENGFNVVLDKPLCLNLTEAKDLLAVQKKTNALFCLTHTYTGYPMLKEAKTMIAKGTLGTLRKVYVEYPQAWLSTALEQQENNKQAAWRTDPTKSGQGGCIGDIGTHAFNLAEYVTGLQVIKVSAHLETYVPQRLLDDDAMMMLQFNGGATGVLMATQIAAGEENNLKIRVYGEHGGIEWQQQDANTLQVKMLNQPVAIYRAGTNYVSTLTQQNSRTPAGHPEGYLEAFANIYNNFASALLHKKNNTSFPLQHDDFPSLEDGIRGMAFIETVIASNTSKEKWTPFTY